MVATPEERRYCRDQYKVVQPNQGGDSDTVKTEEHPEYQRILQWNRENMTRQSPVPDADQWSSWSSPSPTSSDFPTHVLTKFRKQAQGDLVLCDTTLRVSLFSKKLASNRQPENDNPNGVCAELHTPTRTFSALLFSDKHLTHFARSQHFYGSRSDCKNVPSSHHYCLAPPECDGYHIDF